MTEAQLVAAFAVARDRDRNTPPVWEEIVVRNADRIALRVKLHTFPNGDRIRPDRVEDATSEAYLRVLESHFNGRTVGELRMAIRQWVWNACMDHGRRELRHDKRYGASFDNVSPGSDRDE